MGAEILGYEPEKEQWTMIYSMCFQFDNVPQYYKKRNFHTNYVFRMKQYVMYKYLVCTQFENYLCFNLQPKKNMDLFTLFFILSSYMYTIHNYIFIMCARKLLYFEFFFLRN